MKTHRLILNAVAMAALTSCAATDKWLYSKTGIDSRGWTLLLLSGSQKADALKGEYETLKEVQVTAQK
jgi:hypothetical protein